MCEIYERNCDVMAEIVPAGSHWGVCEIMLGFVDCVDGLAQDCSNSIANALELLQSCAEPMVCSAFWCEKLQEVKQRGSVLHIEGAV